MHIKVFFKLKKTLKTLSSGQIYKKTKKKTKNPKKQKHTKKTTGLVFKNPGFFQP
jgi:UDP-N-acetylenolpyruvoylglucosamine reductase